MAYDNGLVLFGSAADALAGAGTLLNSSNDDAQTSIDTGSADPKMWMLEVRAGTITGGAVAFCTIQQSSDDSNWPADALAGTVDNICITEKVSATQALVATDGVTITTGTTSVLALWAKRIPPRYYFRSTKRYIRAFITLTGTSIAAYSLQLTPVLDTN